MTPTEAQKRAGNYAKDHRIVAGMRVSVENKAGTDRTGTDKQGNAWKQTLFHDYGYIRGTTGRDKDHIDAFLGPLADKKDVPVYVIDQGNEDGTFDEHKVMLGFNSEQDATDAYHANYEPGWRGFQDIKPLSMTDFKNWAFTDGARKKPIALCKGGSVRGYADGGVVTNEGGAAFLSPGMGKRSRNDRAASADMPVHAARGWAAGTLGLPGDLEGLARTAIRAGASPGSYVDRNMSAEPTLPTSDFYKGWLPGADERPGPAAAADLGSLFGGVGAGRLARSAAGAVKGALSTLGSSMAAARPAYVPSAQLGAVKLPGGNWVPDSVENFIGGIRPAGDDPVAGWMHKQLKRYVQNDMGTAGDPLLKLEKEGRLHLDQDHVMQRIEQANGMEPGHPDGIELPQYGRPGVDFYTDDKFHIAQTGREYRTPWEHYTDTGITKVSAEGAKMDHGKIPDWMAKLGSEAELHHIDPYDLMGFHHVGDYMDAGVRAHNLNKSFSPAEWALTAYDNERNLVNAGLGLDPAKLSRMSVPDIVGKTADWDKLLAKQKPGLDMNVGVKQVHKQYDNGQQWVELDPEGLKAESAAMKHCVGGYCDSVASGAKRILSLRGQDGKPMVTVEATPGKPWNERSGIFYDNPKLEPSWVEFARESAAKGESPSTYIKKYPEWLQQTRPELHAEYSTVFKDDPHNIVQIKGPANRKPSAEAMAQVQDLVKGGVPGFENWTSVGDLSNSDLLKGSKGATNIRQGDKKFAVSMPEAPYYTRKELAQHFMDQGVPEWEARRHAGDVEGFASGGQVPLRPMTTPGGGRAYQNFASTQPTNLGSGYMFSPEFDTFKATQGSGGMGRSSEASNPNATSGIGGWAGPVGVAVGMATGNPGMGTLAGAALSDNPGQAFGRAALGTMARRAFGLPGALAFGLTSDDPMGAMGTVAGSAFAGPVGGLVGGWAGRKIGDVANNISLRSETRNHMNAEQQAAAAEYSASLGAGNTATIGTTTGDFSRADRAMGESGSTSGGLGNTSSESSGRGSYSGGMGSNSNDGHGFARGGPIRKRNRSWT